MNYFLILIILALGGGGYYEYTTLQQQNATDHQALTELQAKFDTIQAENQKLQDENTQLTKGVADAQAKAADLAKQLQAAQGSVPPAVPLLASQGMSGAGAGGTAPTTPAAPATNNLGTIVTLDGKTFPNGQLMKVQSDGVVISYPGGITQIAYAVMPPDLQKRFGYDPHQAAALTEAQIEYQEEQRKAAQTSGN
jgi:hypothetical protein